jgi:hypothetical protein
MHAVEFPNLYQVKASPSGSGVGITSCDPPEVYRNVVVCFYHRFLWRTCESNLTLKQANRCIGCEWWSFVKTMADNFLVQLLHWQLK